MASAIDTAQGEGRFLSLVTMTVGSVVAIFNLAGSALVDVFTAYGNEYGGLMALRIISLGLYVVDFILYGRIREYPYENAGERFSGARPGDTAAEKQSFTCARSR